MDHMVLGEGDRHAEAGGTMAAHPSRRGRRQPGHEPLQHDLLHDARRGPDFRLQPPSGEVRQALGVGEGAVLVGHAQVAEPPPLFLGAIPGSVQHSLSHILVDTPRSRGQAMGSLLGFPRQQW